MDLNKLIRGLFGFERYFPNSQNQMGESKDFFADTADRSYHEDLNSTENEFPSSFGNFEVFMPDPQQIFAVFEQQMDEMINSFQSLLLSPFLGETPFSSLPEQILPPNNGSVRATGTKLRDQMLKPDARQGWGGYEDRKEKRDEDLDPMISEGRFDALLLPSTSRQEPTQSWRGNSFGHSESVSQSVSTSVRDINGAVEKKSIISSSDGTQEIVTTQQLGDRTYVSTTRKRPGLPDEREERFVNCDAGTLIDFQDEWTRRTGQQQTSSSWSTAVHLPNELLKGLMKGIFG